jgi:hypothetical protein
MMGTTLRRSAAATLGAARAAGSLRQQTCARPIDMVFYKKHSPSKLSDPSAMEITWAHYGGAASNVAWRAAACGGQLR